jgi:Arc/MetJ-type ribon-helix-helix transcriptional regulator
MPRAKVAITLDAVLLHRLDRLVDDGRYPNRSRVVQEAVQEKLDRLERSRLALECAKLDTGEEQQLAEEGLAEDFRQWPEY